jgi:hypothetical protein
MATEDSLPHIQQPATCPYTEPDQSSPCFLIPLLEDPFYSSCPISIPLSTAYVVPLGSVQVRGLEKCFVHVYGEELSPRPNSQVGGQPLAGCSRVLVTAVMNLRVP